MNQNTRFTDMVGMEVADNIVVNSNRLIKIISLDSFDYCIVLTRL